MKPCIVVVDFSDGSFLVRHVDTQLEYKAFNQEISKSDSEILGIEVYVDEEMVY